MATGNIFLYRMGAGIPGAVNREWAAVSVPNILDATNYPTAYGDPCKLVAGKVCALQAGDTPNVIYGFLERPNIHQGVGYPTQGFGAAAPTAGALCSVLKSGYMTVLLTNTTASAASGQIFIRLAGTIPSGGKIGGIEAAADTAGSTAASAAKVGNTGNGTMALDGTAPVQANAISGVYTVVYSSATAFTVSDPLGRVLGNGVNGTAFNNQIKFVNTAGGTAFVSGDTFNVTVTLGDNTFGIPLPNSYFRGAADANGNVEIAFNL